MDVHTAGSGLQAVELASSESFDLIITDIRMEGMDGLEALEKVKEAQPDIASLVITGYSTEEDSIRAIRLGVGEYLKKPFRLPTLLESVGQMMEKRRHRESSEALALTLLSLLESMLRKAKSDPAWIQASRTAEKVAEKMGLSEKQSLWTRVAVLAKVLTESDAQLAEALPARLTAVLKSVEEPWNEITSEARIVAAVLQLHSEAEDYDPEVTAALVDQSDTATTRTGTRLLSGLLSLADALLQKGKTEEARQALLTVLEKGKNRRQEMDSALALSDLEQSQGKTEAALSYASRALQASARMGPRMAAQQHLKAAAQWSPHLPEEGQVWFERARDLSQEIKDPVLVAVADLGLLTFQFDSGPVWPKLEVLTSPVGAPELVKAIPWLLPGLLNCTEEPVEQILESWAVDFIDVFSTLLRSKSLDAPSTLRAVELLKRGGSSEASNVLEPLLSHPEAEVVQAARAALAELNEKGPSRATLRLQSFGKFQVYRGLERCKDWKTQKVRYLLAYLAAHQGNRVPDDQLIEAFWPDKEIAKGKKSLNTALSFLRSNLKKSLGVEDLIDRNPAGVVLHPDLPIWHDVEEFQKVSRQAPELAKQGGPGLESGLQAMLDLYKGSYLEGCYMNWAAEQRRHLERYAREASLKLVEVFSQQSQDAKVVESATRALELDPCSERAAVCLLQAYGRLGRREEAVRFYREFCKTLSEELELEPGDELLTAAQAVGAE
jgi:two-component SAPR family response regulator/soluble cytochrome b562